MLVAERELDLLAREAALGAQIRRPRQSMRASKIAPAMLAPVWRRCRRCPNLDMRGTFADPPARGFIPIGRCRGGRRFVASAGMSALASTVVDLARIQFATTSIYHFLFVPLTLGLGPLVAVMQTIWHRTGNEAWLRLTRFFGTLFLINFAIGVATGLVQEFEFGMNWSVYSKFVGNVFGAPLAIEGLAAFFLESTFLGLWIFGWNRLSPRIHLATLWIAVIGTWMSGYFILVANSWMQHPVGYKVVNGQAQLTSVWALLSNGFALRAYIHIILAAMSFGSIVMPGIYCWHFLRGHDVELFRKAAMLALIVAVPATLLQLVVGNRFGEAVTSAQSMKIATSEAQWSTCQPCGFSLLQFGGFSEQDPKPSFSITVPRVLSYMATGSFSGKVEGIDELQAQEQQKYGAGNYVPNVRVDYWSMRVMAYMGVLMFLVAAVGAWLYRKRKLERARWFHRTAIVAIAFPYIAATAGWLLTEMGRQPWIVQGLLKTDQANSPNVGTTWLGISLGVFVALYVTLGVVDFVLMRRYARPDRPAPREELPVPAVTF
jgi:cytochrome bd ubiquinol oxidase subunit I